VTGQRAHTRETAASVAQYVLLGGFAAVAAGISAQGLTGFARSNMELTGAWPYLLFLALDGAAGVCAVLLVRRAVRAESGLAPRLAVWGLVAASSTFNWTHAPRRPAAAEAFGLMPVIAALLFEFCLRELRQRTMTDRADRKLSTLRWLHPAEHIRVQLRMAADEQLSAEAATRHVRVEHAARRLYQLRAALDVHDQPDAHTALAARRVRRAEHRAHRALTRAGFADPAIAVAVLRQVQVLTMTAALARLDYRTADAAQAAITNLIATPAAAKPGPGTAAPTGYPTAQDGTAGKNAPPERASVNQVNGSRVQEAAREVRTPEDWARCLQAAARLPAETWANVLLISSRRPGATLVKGYEAWRAAGRQVNRDERGIKIFSAARLQSGNRHDHGDDEQGRSWREADHVVYAWDLSQTSGQPLPARAAVPSPPGEVPPGLWDALCWLIRREGFAVERGSGCPDDGTTLWAARRIRVLSGLTGGKAIWALAHQLGHVLLHDTSAPVPGATTTGCQGVRKAEADSVAFITCVRHGVPVEHAFSSPQTWAGTDLRAQPGAAILVAGERVTLAAARIGRHLDHNLPGSTVGLAAPARAETAALAAAAVAAASSSGRDPGIEDVLLDAERFYLTLHRRQLGACLPAEPRHNRRGDGGVAHRIRPPRVDA